jgi:hypothetical protein
MMSIFAATSLHTLSLITDNHRPPKGVSGAVTKTSARVGVIYNAPSAVHSRDWILVLMMAI